MQWPPRPGPGIERHEAERLGGRGLHDFPHVDAHAVAHQRQLVDHADVDGAERVLEQLHHLGDARRADRDDRRDRAVVERRGERGAVRGHAADDLRNVVGVERAVRRVDALGRERQEEVLADLEAALLEHRQHELVGRARIGGRLQDDQLPGTQPLPRSPRPTVTMKDMSGSFVLRSGVGTQMLMVSSSASTSKSVVARSRFAALQLRDVLRWARRRCTSGPR